MGSKSQKMEVVEYYMSIHYGIAAGPLDEIRAILVNEKEAWKGSISEQTEFSINKPDLFGGVKKEGGVSGKVTYLPGGAGQLIPEFLANKLGLTSATCPGYRGISSLWFTGNGNEGFYWTANSPYIQGTWVVASRAPKSLNGSTAMMLDKDGKRSLANPMHVMAEAIMNDDWGIGASASGLNITAFNQCAQTLYNEKFGISLLWTAAQSVEDFVSNILTYVDGVMYVNPRDGLLTPKLIRGDYDPDTLFEINPDNATLTNFQRKLWGETINEIVVEWTNPENEETETVSIQDLANIAIQGAVVSDKNPYEAIRDKDLAMEVAARDLRVASAPLASCEALVDRDAWDITPGSVCKLSWPKHGITSAVMRVGAVDYGKIGDSKIKVALMEDVFSLDTQAYDPPPTSGWIDPSENPRPLVYTLIFTLPYYMTRRMVDNNTLATLDDGEVIAGVLGSQTGSDTQEFTLASMGVDTLGQPVVEYGSELATQTRGVISTALPFAIESIVSISGMTSGDGLVNGAFAILGTTDENMEICLVKNVVGNNCTLVRGIFDTTPKEWPVGSPIWIFEDDAVIDDQEVHTAGELLVVRPLPTTSRGTLAYADGVNVEGRMTNRPWLPQRPADVKVANVAWGLVNGIGVNSFNVTWKNRNRLTEDTVILDWDDANVPVESGQTTSILVLNPVSRAVVSRQDGLTGTSYSLPRSAFGALSAGIVKVISVRDGQDSIQGHEILVKVSSGYGYGYGLNYGRST